MGLGQELGRPKAILAISAHWDSRSSFKVNTTEKPETIHDFGGFPTPLYQFQYPSPGDPVLAAQVMEGLEAAGLAAQADPRHGLDHGIWIPLMLMYPAADIPAIQISLQTRSGPEAHFRLGEVLRNLSINGALIFASGGATHNLGAITMDNSPPPDWVQAFDEWVEENVTTGNLEDLLHYQERAPYARQNHPTPEHFYPLFVALGASGHHQGTLLHKSIELGTLSMAAYSFPALSRVPVK